MIRNSKTEINTNLLSPDGGVSVRFPDLAVSDITLYNVLRHNKGSISGPFSFPLLESSKNVDWVEVDGNESKWNYCRVKWTNPNWETKQARWIWNTNGNAKRFKLVKINDGHYQLISNDVIPEILDCIVVYDYAGAARKLNWYDLKNMVAYRITLHKLPTEIKDTSVEVKQDIPAIYIPKHLNTDVDVIFNDALTLSDEKKLNKLKAWLGQIQKGVAASLFKVRDKDDEKILAALRMRYVNRAELLLLLENV